jgi:hypothetical protein
MTEVTHSISIGNCGHGISYVVWGNMAWVDFVPKVIGVDMGLY